MHKKTKAHRLLALLLSVIMVVSLFPVTAFAQGGIYNLNAGDSSAANPNTPNALSDGAGDVTLKPFYLVNWDRNIETNAYSNAYYMPYTWTKIYAEGTEAAKTDWYYPEEDRIAIGLYFKGKSTSNIDTAAQWLYEEFSVRPAGTRYINLAALGTTFRALAKDAIDFEDAIRLTSKWLDEFLTKYKALGGELDGFAIDLEYNLYTSFYIQSHWCSPYTEDGVEKEPRNIDILQDIVRNERVYQAKIRPQLVELEQQGLFSFWTGGSGTDTSTGESITITIDPATGLPTNPNAAKNSISKLPIPVSELTSINRYDSDGGNETSRNAWSVVLQRHLVDSINRATFEPLIKHYPDAILSDYSHGDSFVWHKGFSANGGTTGTGAKAGNTSNGVYYGSGVGEYFYHTGSGSATRKVYYKPVGQDGAVYEVDTPYSVFEREINNHKRIVASAVDNGTEHTNVWIPYFHYSSNTKSYGNTAYYSELLFHLGMTNPEPFFGYLIESEVNSKGKNSAYAHDPNYGDFQYAVGITNELLAELTRVAGASDRKPIVTPIEWDDHFMLSGMYAGGRNIWRITPDATKISVEDFKVEGKTAPTFSANGVTVTFPQGRIIEDATITQIGTNGYWVETPADVTPVITRSANYIEEHPSFADDFEDYIVGDFTGSAASIDKTLYSSVYRPDTYWVKSGDGTAAIVDNNGNKALTLTGTTTIKNGSGYDASNQKPSNTIPAFVTAGDYFAKQQAWEVTVTMPSSFSGTTKLLGYSTGTDGFQINSSGYVYYPYIYSSGSSGYFSRISSTKLTAGQTYTFKRVIDFTAKTCSYYVYNANGGLVMSATGKKILNVTTPVSKIYMSTSGVTGTVTIDDYKLYPVGVTANMDLYEELTLSQFADYIGYVRKVTDTTAARTSKTFYRVSYMNASTGYQKAILKNSETGAVIEEVLMAPGDSGYFTGYVDATASAPVTFALTTQSATAPSTPDYESGDFTWAGYAENLGITCYVIDQGYAKLEDALAAAKDGQTVVMIADAEMASTAVVDSAVKINTNGHKITVADNFDGDAAITLVAGGNLTWDDSLVINAGSKAALCVNGGNLTVTGGQITAKTGILVNGGTLTVSGGTVTATESAIALSQDAAKSAATVTVTGGTLTGENAFLHSNVNATPSENLTVSISGTTLNGEMKTTEEHFEIQEDGGVYTLHGHTVVIHAAKAPTCTDTGLTQGIEYPCCSMFAVAQEEIPATGHTWVDATYCGATKSCSVCGITDGDPKEHTFGSPVVTPHNCTEDGYTTETCTLCGYEKIYDIVPAAHEPGKIQVENVTPANCTESGSREDVIYCTVCKDEISRTKVTTDPATGHTDGTAVKENNVLPTCTDSGSYDSVTYCTVCKAETSRQTIPVEATGHTPGEIVVENQVAMTCTEDGSYDNVKYCDICQAEVSRETIIIPAPVGGHDKDGFRKDVYSVGNCTTDDSYDNVVYCTACGYEHSRVNVFKAAPGHKYVVGQTHVTCQNCDYSQEIGTASLVITTGTNDAKVQWKPALSIGMAPAYAKTTAEGALVLEGATAADYNLKVEWPVGGKPTLTMNGATLANSTQTIDNTDFTVVHTIVLGGTADFEILLKGTNTINGGHVQMAAGTTNVANHRMPAGIFAANIGTLTIKSLDKAVDTLTIDNNGGNGILKQYNALTIDSANVTINMQTTASNGQNAIVMVTYGTAYADMTNLTIVNSTVKVWGAGRYSGNSFIIMGRAGATYSAENTGDILFQNSTITMNRNNGSSVNSAGGEAIRYSPNGSMTIDRCDFDLRGNHRTFNYAPTVTNCANVQVKTGWSDWTDYTVTPGTALTANTNNSGLKGTHVCLHGEPVVEFVSKGDCNVVKETVTYCVVCNDRIVDETKTEDASTKDHTPGTKTLVEGSMTKPTNQGHSSVTEKGTYTLQCTCSVCGETWTETEEYLPAVLYYISPSADYHSTADKTVPKYQLNAYWGNQGTSYKPTLTVLPGETVYFVTETGTNTNIPTNAYMRKLSTGTADKAIIDAGTWNIKLEYPIGGTPVLTMQDATIINCFGLWYGYAGFRNLAPLTVILKGENTIRQPRYTNGGGLNFKTMSPVTITGDGSLDLFTYANLAGIRSYGGDLIFDHANIQYTHYTSGSAGDAVQTETAGNIIIDGGTFNMIGANPTKQDAANGFNSKGDIIIKGGANVSLTNALADKTYYMLKAAGNITISESTVKLACAYYGSAISYGGELTLEYVNGLTGNAIYARPTLDPDTLEYTYPDLTGAVKLSGAADVIANKDKYYLDIAPVKALAKFTGTSVTVEEDLDVNFKLDADKVDTEGTVKFTVNGEDKTYNLSEVGKTEGNDYIITLPGLTAKEMTKEITVTVYDSEGNPISETKTDSVQAYALRLLRSGKYDADTEINNALKTFLVDMLIYGSMAQTRFLDKEAVGELPTAVLNATEWSYATIELETEAPTTKPDANGYLGTAFDLKSDIGMAIALDAKVLPDVTKAVVSFTDYMGNSQTATIDQKDASSTAKFTIFTFSTLTAANGRQDITWTFYDSNNAEVLEITDSLAAYVGRMRGENPDLDEMLKYCDSAKAYFTLLNAQSN